MRNLLSVFIVSVIALGFLTTSCSKDEDDTPKLELLTNNKWKATSLNATLPPMPKPIDLMEQNSAASCTMDFSSDETFVMYLNMGNGEEQMSGNWTLSSDEKLLTLSSADKEPMELDILELTKSNFTTRTEYNFQGTLVNIEISMVPQ